MKRLLSGMFIVSILLVLQGLAPSFAQDAAQEKMSAPSWQTVSEGAWKTDLGADMPEVLILRMSNEEFDKFHASEKAAKAYIDGHPFLKKKLNKVVFAEVRPALNGHAWVVIAVHTPHSWVQIVAWQISNEQQK
ncbi:MAG: hypothetical protein WA755_02835 [Candidatus Acidiferrales bacterium]